MACLWLLMGLAFCRSLSAQGDFSEYAFPEVSSSPTLDTRSLNPDTFSAGPGFDGRFGHIALPAFGRDESITPIELFPYIQSDNQILFGDVRGFIDNNGRLGGNAGAGWRFIEPNNLALFGVNAFYDIDDSVGDLFHQVGFGLEARMERAGLAGNFYFPVGNNEQRLGRRILNPRFEDNQLVFDMSNSFGTAMKGVDVAMNVYLPGDVFEDHLVQATAGWYYFTGDNVDDINGFKLQVDGEIISSLHGQVAVTHDDTFGTNVTVGVFWRFGTKAPPERDLRSQMRRFVDRNYNIIVSRETISETGVAAINPLTGNAYTVQHVANGFGSGVGTPDDPWSSILQAQNAGADIIYVRSGTTLNESVVLSEGQHLLGAGSSHTLVDARYGAMTISGDAGSGATPILNGGIGDGIRLADNSHVSGFVVQSPSGRGIVADGIENFSITNVTVNGAGDEGVFIRDSASGSLTSLSVNGAGSHGLFIQNSEAITGSTIKVENSVSDGLHLVEIDDVVELKDVTVNGSGGSGVSVDGGHGLIRFLGDLIINGSSEHGLAVKNLETVTETDDDDNEVEHAGTVRIDNLLVDGAPGSTGVWVTDIDGFVVLHEVDITTENASAVYARNADGVYIGDGTLSSKNAPVIDSEASTLGITLTSIFADGGAYGLRLVDTDGAVLVYGNGVDQNSEDEEGTGGLIKNTDVALYMENSGRLGVQGVHFKGNDVMAEAIESEALEMVYAHVTDTADQFVKATNLSVLEITDSRFEENPLASGSGIQFDVSKSGSFIATVANNFFIDTRGTLFKATSLTGGESAKLTYTLSSNSISLKEAFDIGAHVDWSGVLKGIIQSNIILGSASSQRAVFIDLGDTTNASDFTISSNGFSLSGADSTVIEIDAGAPVTGAISSNQIILAGQDGVGIEARLLKSSNLTIANNLIQDTKGGGTGILFPTVAKGSRLTINGNTIDLSKVNTFIDRGIVLSAISGTDDPFITFESTVSNTISGASTELSVPNEGIRGQLIINNITIR